MSSVLERLQIRARSGMIWRTVWFSYRNLVSRRPITGDGDAVVSLTTYGRRLRSVHLAIESMAAGSSRPERTILWVDEDDALQLPRSIQRLERRGLEVRPAAAELGPHKKYLPHCQEQTGGVLVTADDDVFYPVDWLARLLAAHRDHRDDMIAYRARKIALSADGLAPYAHWDHVHETSSSFAHVSIGVDGVLIPPRLCRELARRSGGVDLAPRSDDLWIHSTAVLAGIRVRQVDDVASGFPSVPFTQAGALMHENVASGGNDVVAARLYSRSAVDTIRRDATSPCPRERGARGPAGRLED